MPERHFTLQLRRDPVLASNTRRNVKELRASINIKVYYMNHEETEEVFIKEMEAEEKFRSSGILWQLTNRRSQ